MTLKPFTAYSFQLIIFLLSNILLNCFTTNAQPVDPKSSFQKYASALQIINFAYVEEVNESKLVEKAIIATLKELDPHSQYISKEDLQAANEPLEANYEGVGLTFQIYRDTILVISPFPGGPSDKLGIRAGDKIVKIEGEDAAGSFLDNDYVMGKLRGEKGSKVNISVFRKGKKKLYNYTITRDKIPINSIDASFMATDNIGYIRLTRFSRSTIDEFHETLEDLKNQGMEKMVLDLRGNSGGYLDVAVDLSDEFLETGRLIVYTEGVSSPKKKYNSSFLGKFEKGKLVILIDEGSASASEIVSGAVQDWDRGLILGRRSFGKGLVQRPYFLPDSSAIRLTVARYFTPSGRCIQKPYDEGYEKYYKDISHRIEHGELAHQDSIQLPDSLIYFTSNHRTVYGGGGIMPDIFVPFDSTIFSDYYMDLLRKGVLNDFVLDYVDNQRDFLLKEYSSVPDFKDHFTLTDKTMEKFYSYADEKNVSPDKEQSGDTHHLISWQIKAMIARNLWDHSAYVEIMSEIDDGFLKAIEVLENDSYFSFLAGN
ncbi:MAG: S41 family peptidase [Bacteroidales bacterium]|nr:S41 family peptidase [Bacteroidales bacterium]